MKKWTIDMIGSLLGKNAIVTGGTDGIGLEIARELARNGARVIICADDFTKGEKASANIRNSMEGALVSYEHLDLSDLESVKVFSERILSEFTQLHLLINNGGIAAVPERMSSKQGHELIFAVNYLSHFALTARLFDLLERTPGSRIIFQSSMEHKQGILDFFDMNATHFYDPAKAYAQSKLAQIVFARELARRIRATNLHMKSIAVHPGAARTHIFTKGPGLSDKMIRPHDLLSKFLVFSLGQSAARGAEPALFAATSKFADSGHYYGPSGYRELRGAPVERESALQTKNTQAAQKLWDLSEELTELEFGIRDFSNVLPFEMKSTKTTDAFS